MNHRGVTCNRSGLVGLDLTDKVPREISPRESLGLRCGILMPTFTKMTSTGLKEFFDDGHRVKLGDNDQRDIVDAPTPATAFGSDFGMHRLPSFGYG